MCCVVALVVALMSLAVVPGLGAGDAERRRVSEVGDTNSLGAAEGEEKEASAGGIGAGLGGSGAPFGNDPRRKGRLGFPTGTCAGFGGNDTAATGAGVIAPIVGTLGGSGAPLGSDPRRVGRR